MNILNDVVYHNKFGMGVVVAQGETDITIKFDNKVSKFQYPMAFQKFLVHENKNIQEQILQEVAALPKVEPIKHIVPPQPPTKNAPHKSSQGKNLAFKCNYCDGGIGNNGIGFGGVCSHKMIQYNIEDKKRSWCSFKGCQCYKYYSNQMTRSELEHIYQDNFVCYEAEMLVNWKAQAGMDHTDTNGIGKGRAIAKAGINNLAVLTTELPKSNGKDRVVFGVFIIGKIFEGDSVQCGFVQAKDGYGIYLTKEESRKIKFWHYHKNKNNPEIAQWGQGLYRYLNDHQCARILADIVSIKTNPQEKAHAQKILEYYCNENHLDINNISPADGVF